MANLTLNRTEIIGFLGKDPEIRNTANARVMNLSVATTESWKDRTSGDWKEKTDWHRITVWAEGAINAFERDRAAKGDLVRITGKLETRKWKDQQGNDRWTTEIVVTGVGDCVIIRTKASPSDRQAAKEAP